MLVAVQGKKKKVDSISHNSLESVSLLCQSHLVTTTKALSKHLYKQLRNKSASTQVLPPLQIHRQLHLPCAYRSKGNLLTLGKCCIWVSSPHIQCGLEVHEPTSWEKLHCSTLHGFVSCGLLNLASPHFSSLCHFTLSYTHIKPVFLHRPKGQC